MASVNLSCTSTRLECYNHGNGSDIHDKHMDISACRAVQVPGQDLATPHLHDTPLRKAYFVSTQSLYTICMCVHAYAHYRGSSRPVLMI